MRIIEDVLRAEVDLPNIVLTIGSFDGIHLGHRCLLDELVQTARGSGGSSAVMTLRPHPRQVFSPENAPNILTCPRKKEQLLAEAGVDLLLVLPFNLKVASMSPGDFVESVIVGRCHARKVIVGHDFAFGQGGRGDFEFLRADARAYGFEVSQVPALVIQGERVSSTLIRERILDGELEKIDRFLGRPYSILGTVVTGRGMGAQLGFATANIEPGIRAVPAHGVYVAEALVGEERHMAAVNIGVAPTIRQADIVIEAHLLDFDRGLVGQTIEVIFHKRLRPEKKFDSYEELKAAIAQDVAKVRAHFA